MLDGFLDCSVNLVSAIVGEAHIHQQFVIGFGLVLYLFEAVPHVLFNQTQVTQYFNTYLLFLEEPILFGQLNEAQLGEFHQPQNLALGPIEVLDRERKQSNHLNVQGQADQQTSF